LQILNLAYKTTCPMIKYIIILLIAASFTLAGCSKSKAPTEAQTSEPAAVTATIPDDNAEQAALSAARIAELEAEKNEAIRMAELQIQKARDEQKKVIAEVQSRLEAEEAARALAEAQAAESKSRLAALEKSLAAAELRQAELAAQTQSASKTRQQELAAAADAVRKAKQEAAHLKRQQEELDRKRLEAIAQQERIEAELRAELENYKKIEDWEYSYAVRGDQYKRQAHAIIQAKLNANPKRN
jgi:hypothetical protein